MRHEYIESVNKNYRRNLFCFILFEFLFGLGYPFALFDTVVPAWLSEINAPKMLIGFICSLPLTICPLQLVVSHFREMKSHKIWLITIYTLCALPWLIYSICLYLFASEQFIYSKLNLAVFTAVMVCFVAGTKGHITIYNSLAMNCMPFNKRGVFNGYSAIALAVAVLAISPVAHKIMSRSHFPDNYLFSFIIGTSFYLLCVLPLFFIRELSEQKRLSKFNLLLKLKAIYRAIARNRRSRVFLFFYTLSLTSVILGSYFIVYAKEKLNLSVSKIIIFTIISMTCSAVATYFLGRIGDKRGYRMVGVFKSLLLLIAYVLFVYFDLSSTKSKFIIYAGFAFYSSVIIISNVLMRNMIIEILPKYEKAILVAAINLFLMPIVLFAVPAAGLIIDLTNSYITVFVVGAIFSAVAMAGYALLMTDFNR